MKFSLDWQKVETHDFKEAFLSSKTNFNEPPYFKSLVIIFYKFIKFKLHFFYAFH